MCFAQLLSSIYFDLYQGSKVKAVYTAYSARKHKCVANLLWLKLFYVCVT